MPFDKIWEFTLDNDMYVGKCFSFLLYIRNVFLVTNDLREKYYSAEWHVCTIEVCRVVWVLVHRAANSLFKRARENQMSGSM